MVREVIKVDPSKTFADCLKLMHLHGIRHLPVVENVTPIAVISIRDLLAEAVDHHARVISGLELERMTMFTSTA
jgi:CBS domain-containing protein